MCIVTVHQDTETCVVDGLPMTVERMFTIIGRGLDKHTSKFASWAELFESTPAILTEKGIPIADTRLITRWTAKYRCAPSLSYHIFLLLSSSLFHGVVHPFLF